MTGKDRQDINREWLKTVKPGDEVCVTNKYDIGRLLMNPFCIDTQEECKISKIRGILPDGHFVVDDVIYDEEGRPENYKPMDISSVLFKPTDELVELSHKLKFIETLNRIDWVKLPFESIENISNSIATELNKFKDIEEENQKDKGSESPPAVTADLLDLTNVSSQNICISKVDNIIKDVESKLEEYKTWHINGRVNIKYEGDQMFICHGHHDEHEPCQWIEYQRVDDGMCDKEVLEDL